MTIETDDAIDKFGTRDVIDASGGSSAVTDGSFSAAADIDAWTNDDDAPEAAFVIDVDYTVAPDANSVIELHAQILNIGVDTSTDDEEVPDSNFSQHLLGRFNINDVTTAQSIVLRTFLPNEFESTEYQFFIRNRTGQTIPAGWAFAVTPIAQGPHA